MARFLLIPHAPGGTLAHLAACISIAGPLRDDGHEALFAYGGDLPGLIEDAGFEWLAVTEATGPMSWEWFESDEQLEGILSSQLEAIEQARPDVCITSAGAGRLAVAAAGNRHLSLHHGLGTSPYGRRGRRRHALLGDLRRPSRALEDIRLQLRPRRRHRSGEIWRNGWIRHTGAPLDRETRATGRADLVACTTTPLLDPARGMPAHWRYTGPLGFSMPGGHAVEIEAGRPRAYVSQGSTGTADLLRRAVEELAAAGFAVIASTGGLCSADELAGLGEGIEAAELHDTRAELRAADLAVIGGGHMTAMEALRAGVPTVVLPRVSSQALSGKRAERLGTGIGLWPRVPNGAIARAALRVHSRPRYLNRAREVARRLEGVIGERDAAALAVALSRETS